MPDGTEQPPVKRKRGGWPQHKPPSGIPATGDGLHGSAKGYRPKAAKAYATDYQPSQCRTPEERAAWKEERDRQRELSFAKICRLRDTAEHEMTQLNAAKFIAESDMPNIRAEITTPGGVPLVNLTTIDPIAAARAYHKLINES